MDSQVIMKTDLQVADIFIIFEVQSSNNDFEEWF